MIRRNVVGIEARSGYATVELYEGDITEIPADIDVLVTSAFAGGYTPTPGTVFGSLKSRLGLSVRDLVRKPEFDFRAALCVWVSRPLTGFPFSRLMCAELVGASKPPEVVIENVFAALTLLEAKGIDCRRVVLPVLGTGLQGLEPKGVIESLLTSARTFAKRSTSLESLRFVEINPVRANELSDAMDIVLGRVKVLLPKSEILAALRGDVQNKLHAAGSLFTPDAFALRNDWLALLVGQDVRSVELGIQARRLVELLVRRLGGTKNEHLHVKIRSLERDGIAAPWICGYMNVLRHLGNESAHEQSTPNRRPPAIEADDLALSLFCVARLLEFWIRDVAGGPPDS